MKKVYAFVWAMLCLQYVGAQQSANKSLSNLNATTSVNRPLLPMTDDSLNLGSVAKSWKDIYLDGAVYRDNIRFIAYTSGTGDNNTALGADVLIDNTSGSFNTGTGFNALYNNTTGYSNTATGSQALFYNTTGYGNVANGYVALYSNTTGDYNTANGRSALYLNTTGSYNVANGGSALRSNTSGDMNSANGYAALYSNTTGFSNVANGYRALYFNTTGNSNTANGAEALYSNTNGIFNTANGGEALYSNTTGDFNTATGKAAMYSNTSGEGNTATGRTALYNNTTGEFNTATGMEALVQNITGSNNTATGKNALYQNISGNYNTATGRAALYYNTSGNNNTGSGYFTLEHNTTGSYNTALGYNADVSSGNLTNATAIGNGAVVNASNKVRIGNSSVTSIGGQVNWTTFSDGRYKKNIQENVKGLAFINALRPVSYTTDVKALEAYFHPRKHNDSADKDMEAMQAVAAAEGSKIIYTGFLAQEVEAAAKKLGYDFSGVDKPATKDGIYGLRYSDFVAPLVKAVQELSKQNDSLKAENENLQKRVERIEALIASSQKQQLPGDNASARISTTTGGALLEQNVPNPFTHTTSIAYTLPAGASSAKIIITDMQGRQLKQFNLSAGRQAVSGKTKGVVHIDASTFASGTYNYSLYADGRLIGSGKMVRN